MPRPSSFPSRLLASLLPPDRLLSSPLQTRLYRSPPFPSLSLPPAAVAFPISPEEVVQLLRFCHEHALPFLPRGSGTSLRGAPGPDSPGTLLISLQQMDRILAIDPIAQTATLQPGVAPGTLDREARLHGLRFPPCPGSRRSSTLGGNLARDAAGPNCHLAGSTASQLLAATLVLPDGSVAECGSASAAGRLGPDPLHLLARSEGALGVVVEMTLALSPLPDAQATLTATFPSSATALEACDALLTSGLLPSRLEFFDRRSWNALTGAPVPGAGSRPVLWCDLEGPREEVAEDTALAAALLRQCGAQQVNDEPPGEQLLQRRDGLPSALGTVLPQDGAVPRSRLAAAVQFLEQVEREESVPVSLSADAANGALFPAFHYQSSSLDSFRKAERAALRFLLHCAESGGSVAACHGLGREKRGLFASVMPEEESRFQHALRAAFHPGTPDAPPPSVVLYPPLPGEPPSPVSP